MLAQVDPVQTYASPRRRPSASPAFTLVELMVVITVIALLLSMLLPAIARSRDQARTIRCESNLRAIALALGMYADCWRGQYPPNSSTLKPAQSWSDMDKVSEYFVPPRTLATLTDISSAAAIARVGSIYVCPNDAPDGVVLSYAMNVWASSKVADNLTEPPLSTGGRTWTSRVKLASKMILVTETFSCQTLTTAGVKLYSPVLPPVVGAAYVNGPAPSYTPIAPTPGQRFGGAGGVVPVSGRFVKLTCELAYYRHRPSGSFGSSAQPRGRINIAYADGHVESKTDADLVLPTGQSTLDSYWSPADLTGYWIGTH